MAVGPQSPHLGGALEVVVVAVEGEPLAGPVAGRDVHGAAGVDAEQVLLRGRVLAVDVVGVVGGDQRDLEVGRELEQPVADPLLDGEVVVHQLEEVVVAAEDVLEVGGRLAGGVVVAVAQVHLHLARRATGGADQAGRVLGQQLAVHAGLLEEAVLPGAAGEPEQVVHALGGLREQGHVGVGAPRRDVVGTAVVEVDALALEAGDVGSEVGLDADDGLDARVAGALVELVGAEDVAVVGHRHGRHAELGRALGQRAEPGSAVEHGVLGVHVQVDEGVVGTCRHGGEDSSADLSSGTAAQPRLDAGRPSWGRTPDYATTSPHRGRDRRHSADRLTAGQTQSRRLSVIGSGTVDIRAARPIPARPVGVASIDSKGAIMATTSISRRGLLQAGGTAAAGMSVLQISGPAEALGTRSARLSSLAA